MLVWTLFIALPMVIFQQAKDMKLDPWFFFVSIICVYLIYKYVLREPKKSITSKIKGKLSSLSSIFKWWNSEELPINMILIWIIGILAWFAFTIKFTALLLISAMIGVLFFARLWIFWFLWYISMYFTLFTKAWFWSMMNVVYPKENLEFINIFSLWALVFWIVCLVLSSYKNIEKFKKLLIELCVFLLAALIWVLPWISKNIYDTYPNISISNVLSWTSERFNIDYTKIYSESDLENKKETIFKSSLSSSWTTTNEDLWRYFWYEKGINNYVKLPWNLTMQLNQGWEFTGISYIFLALLPVIFLFLPFRKKYFALWILALLLLELLIYVIPSSRIFFTYLFSQFSLPWGYSIILWVFLLPLIYFVSTLKDTAKIKLFNINFVFASFYTFLCYKGIL